MYFDRQNLAEKKHEFRIFSDFFLLLCTSLQNIVKYIMMFLASGNLAVIPFSLRNYSTKNSARQGRI